MSIAFQHIRVVVSGTTRSVLLWNSAHPLSSCVSFLKTVILKELFLCQRYWLIENSFSCPQHICCSLIPSFLAIFLLMKDLFKHTDSPWLTIGHLATIRSYDWPQKRRRMTWIWSPNGQAAFAVMWLNFGHSALWLHLWPFAVSYYHVTAFYNGVSLLNDFSTHLILMLSKAREAWWCSD